MDSLDPELTVGYQGNLIPVFGNVQRSVEIAGSVFSFVLRADKQLSDGTVSSEFAHQRIVLIQNEKILRVLIHADPFFRVHVIIHDLITVEMIGRKIKDQRGLRLEFSDAVQLECGNFGYENIFRL